MKKTAKILSIVLLAVMMVAFMATMVNAAPDTVISGLQSPDYGNEGEITKLGQKIVGIIQIVGVVIAVVVILVIGIKYLIGSAEEKAEYKKTMIPYLVGAVLVFAGATIVNVVYNVVTGLNS